MKHSTVTPSPPLQPILDRALPSLPLMTAMGRQRPPRGSAALISITSAMRLEAVVQGDTEVVGNTLFQDPTAVLRFAACDDLEYRTAQLSSRTGRSDSASLDSSESLRPEQN